MVMGEGRADGLTHLKTAVLGEESDLRRRERIVVR